MKTSSPPAGLDLARLPRMSAEELRRVWTQHIGRRAPPAQKRLLIRELAWRVQERSLGGLDAETARLLKAAMRAATRCASSPLKKGVF